MRAPSRKSVQVAQMKRMGCLEETQSCRKEMAGDSKPPKYLPNNPVPFFQRVKYPRLF